MHDVTKLEGNSITEEICIMVNVKFEEQYLDEWITYHACLGVDKFYLYDNNDDDTLTKKALETCRFKHLVTIHWMPGLFVMPRATSHWLQTYKHKHKAVMFIDVDEFFVLHKHNSLKELLAEYLYPRGGGLAINWVLFGDNGLVENDLDLVTKRFVKRQNSPDKHVKSIAMCKDLITRIYTHGVSLVPGTYNKDTNGTIVHDAFNFNGPIDVVQLNHYFCKTRPEWERKRNKGHCDMPLGTRRTSIEFHAHNLNDIEDTKAQEFYLKISQM